MKENPLPIIAPDICVDDPITDDEIAAKKAQDVLGKLNEAIKASDADKLEQCFFPQQAYWRDQIALTWHLRTFFNRHVIAARLLETEALRGVAGEGFQMEGHAHFIPALQAIAFPFSFRTGSPGARCSGRIMLLPSEADSSESTGLKHVTWKIWVLCTWIEQLDLHPEDEALLRGPCRRQLDSAETIETDVLIIGGGNTAISTAARLKALNIESVIVERNPRAGDNWALRYDCLCFHIPTSSCELPYMRYDAELQFPHMLTRDELAAHVRRYVETFNLNIITAAKVTHTQYNTKTKRWTVMIQTPDHHTTVISKHLVQATGFGSQKPYMPPMQSPDLYKGVSIHSAGYKNAKELVDKGAKSVLVVGSANTAFDIMEDCHAAGLQTTMAVRSPTYLLPIEYMTRPETLGAYDLLGVEAADRMFQTGPTVVDGALLQSTIGRMAGAEPNRYEKLASTGFPVLESASPGAVLSSNLYERAGGHYVDVGGTAPLADGKVGVKVGDPVGFHEEGLSFQDGSSVEADAVVWCTGYADKNARNTAAEILGGGGGGGGDIALKNGKLEDKSGEKQNDDILGPCEIASRIDATWGLDAEGEIRGLAKRQLGAENYWAIGGPSNTSRWYSKLLAIQIKADMEGVLPPAYRETAGWTR
ncbi:FAD/NAD(P)-binding domain-containing protein [Apiospora saccharicola]|uniref:FAD/NAD(P)-binding domain-containing protein n=1 Tax=Apiospora saccharicola TaxID=335842 RepID=A0ABR1W439_9PEZI